MFQYSGIAQDAEHRIGDVVGLGQIEPPRRHDFVAGVDDVAQHCEQVLLHAPNHSAIHKSRGWGMGKVQLHAPRLAHQSQVKGRITLEQFARVIAIAAAVQHREGAPPKQGVEASLPRVQKLQHFLLGEVLQHTTRCHAGIDEITTLWGAWKMQGRVDGQGRISTGMLLRVNSQISSMSSLLTAIQPLVQSISR